jgi:hypothetical protein
VKRSDINPLPQFFDRYILLMEDEEVITSLQKSLVELEQLDRGKLRAKAQFRYAEGKWTVAELFQHLLDNERIQAYRALRFSRNDTTVLPGYDENVLAEYSETSRRTIDDILDEFILVRRANIMMFASMSDVALQRKGMAFKVEITPLGLAFQMTGHQRHHLRVLEERYFW